MWKCSTCQEIYTADVMQCPRCHLKCHRMKGLGKRTGEEARWICERDYGSGMCGTVNSLDRDRCSQCYGSKLYNAELLSVPRVKQQINDAIMEEAGDATSVPGRAGDQQPADSGATGGPPASTLLTSLRPAVEEMLTNPMQCPQEGEDQGIPDSSQDEAAVAGVAAGIRSLNLAPAPREEEVVQFPGAECRLVLVGKTGHGKSHTGNTILGLDRFRHSPGFRSTTLRCDHGYSLRFGIRLEVVDTPGLFDTHLEEETVITELSRCLGLIAPGPHAIVMVLRISRFTEEEIQTLEKLEKMFGAQLLRFLVIVFTQGDRLDKSGEGGEEGALRHLLDSSPAKLKELIARVNNRYVVVDNTAGQAAKQQQVKKLLQIIADLHAVNGRRPYTSNLLEQVERCMCRRERQLQEEQSDTRERGEHESQGGENLPLREQAREELAVKDSSSVLKEIRETVVQILTPVLLEVVRHLMGKMEEKGYCSIQ